MTWWMMWMACAKHDVVSVPTTQLTSEDTQFWSTHPIGLERPFYPMI